ncbi:sodium transport system ATP-binding protein [Tumebacillus sp. BK434]|uniref:ABC transporter ATP-binding protein n=1 Tax=Tumebacillus sp. BK434 TaxID=2512169 RepID=UPI0010538516|nr:ATP-binding cassette domain-containing protein [Tumebacillus sp. BK434]TCP52115.1 sodium transport system ATP-binding protein [Tumebacillus sp. BK434]
MIEVQGVTKKFGDFTAVKGLTFTAGQGEVVGMLGENGAGKTTTLRMISTVLKPTHGSISVGGKDAVRQAEEVRKQVGILFGGETGLYDRLTARENIRYFGKLYGLEQSVVEARTESLAKRFDMTRYLDKRVGGFSKGMKQKVAIARSLIHDPNVVLFDEPTSGLDITSANVIRQLLGEFKQEGRTVIFSSHIMSEVERLCDRVVILHRGELQYNGTLDALYEQNGTNDLDRIFMEMVGEGQ